MVKRESRKKQITVKRQEQIIKAALTVFSQKGYAAATIPEIARLAGVAAGTIYIYYASKRELFVSVIKSMVITVPLLGLLENMQKADFATALKDVLKDRLNLAEGDRIARISTLMSDIQRDPELKALLADRLLRPIMDMMEGYYRAGIDEGRLRPYDPEVIVRAIGGMIIGTVMLKSLEGERGPLSQLPRDKTSEDMVELVLHGLLADGAGDKK
jgi:AcrR family transcriptional regulator